MVDNTTITDETRQFIKQRKVPTELTQRDAIMKALDSAQSTFSQRFMSNLAPIGAGFIIVDLVRWLIDDGFEPVRLLISGALLAIGLSYQYRLRQENRELAEYKKTLNHLKL